MMIMRQNHINEYEYTGYESSCIFFNTGSFIYLDINLLAISLWLPLGTNRSTVQSKSTQIGKDRGKEFLRRIMWVGWLASLPALNGH